MNGHGQRSPPENRYYCIRDSAIGLGLAPYSKDITVFQGHNCEYCSDFPMKNSSLDHDHIIRMAPPSKRHLSHVSTESGSSLATVQTFPCRSESFRHEHARLAENDHRMARSREKSMLSNPIEHGQITLNQSHSYYNPPSI